MLVLRSSPPSPFGRKVRVAAALLGLSERLRVETADTNNPGDSLRGQNPLGKIPTLVLEDGSTLYDSRVIVEYLDWLAGGGKIIPAPPLRFEALKLQALADGIMDAALLRVYEGRYREADRTSGKWLDLQKGKMDRALASLEAAPPGSLTDIGAISLACALGYLDLRFEGKWRTAYPRLLAWLERFAAATPSYAAG